MCENNASKFNLKHRKSFNRFLNHAVDKVPTYTVDVISPYLPCHLKIKHIRGKIRPQ